MTFENRRDAEPQRRTSKEVVNVVGDGNTVLTGGADLSESGDPDRSKTAWIGSISNGVSAVAAVAMVLIMVYQPIACVRDGPDPVQPPGPAESSPSSSAAEDVPRIDATGSEEGGSSQPESHVPKRVPILESESVTLFVSQEVLEQGEFDIEYFTKGADGEHPATEALRFAWRRVPHLSSSQGRKLLQDAAEAASEEAEHLTEAELQLIDDTYRVLGIDKVVIREGAGDWSPKKPDPTRNARSWRDGPESVALLVGEFGEYSIDDVIHAVQRVIPSVSDN